MDFLRALGPPRCRTRGGNRRGRAREETQEALGRYDLAPKPAPAVTDGPLGSPNSCLGGDDLDSRGNRKTWVQLRAVRLPAYYAQHWASWEEGQTGILTNHLDVPLPNAKARAFKLWLDYHQRELFPDRAAVRATWDQTCAELLRACRQQRDYCESAAGAFETWSFSAEPSIAYLAIELMAPPSGHRVIRLSSSS